MRTLEAVLPLCTMRSHVVPLFLPLCLIFISVFAQQGDAAAGDVAKRSDDADPLLPLVQQLSARLAQLEAKQSADEARLALLEHQVAFKVTFTASIVHLARAGPYKFDRVVFNDGAAYSPLLGVFTAPVPGVYTFTFQILTHVTETPVVDLVVNGNVASRMVMDTTNQSGSQSDSTTVTAKLGGGDKVWVQTGNDADLDVYGPNHTFFAGALLYRY